MNRMNVYYPNRKLGMEHAATPPEDAWAPFAIANVALSNLRQDDTVRIYRDKPMIVEKITKRQLTLRDHQGGSHKYTVDGKHWEQLLRDVSGAIEGSMHGCDCGDLVKALQRDPAYAVGPQGIHCLRDIPPAA